jgi:lysyl-tRNA synthetase, class I
MFWTEEVAAKCSGPQIINDSKTPSGRVHVGALRGVLIHDAIFRTLREKGIEARYLFGVDDYDPLDEIPAGKGQHFEKYLGQPLCNVPPPDNSPATDMAEHYIGEFFEIFDELGVKAEKYRMRDVYKSGRFNNAIDTILQNAATVRRVYKEVSNSDRAETWYPFQAVCEQCGRIGTTEVFAYDGREVSYRCRADLVKWARGCGHEGRVSPFDGRGKLPWKLEWVAKWVTFPVTIEGAGKDHSTKGGSRDVSAACLRAIFGKEPPLNVPYEFFLVGGAKMSSSRGVGASAREIADLLPPEVLRFLMIRTKPLSPVNFDVKEEGIVKLFNEFDRFHTRAVHDKNATPDEACVYRLSELKPEGELPGGLRAGAIAAPRRG